MAIIVLLMGSRIVATAPEENSIDSSAASYACSAGEACAADLDHEGLEETLTAIHEPADEISSLQDAGFSDCSDSSISACSGVHAGESSRYPQLAMLLHSGESTEMSSVFVASDSDQSEAAPTFTVRSSQSTSYYSIDGDTSSELWNELRGDANPLSELPGVGRKPLGEASFAYNYSYQSDYGATMSQCLVKYGEIDVQFETVLPRLEDQEGKPDRLRRQWEKFQSVVVDHEAGHLKIYQRLLDELPEAMSAIGAVPCEELDSRVVAVVSHVVDSVHRASSHYDARTGDEKYRPYEL